LKKYSVLSLIALIIATTGCNYSTDASPDSVTTIYDSNGAEKCFLDKNGLYYSFTFYLSNNLCVSVDGDIKNTNYTHLAEDITIPETITTHDGNTYEVIAISNNAFRGCTRIKRVKVSDKTKIIGDSAFYKSSLTDITIGSSIEQISKGSFAECNSLETVVIPNSVIHVCENAFSGCANLTTLTIGKAVQIIDFPNFSGCNKLATINFNATKCVFFGSLRPPLFPSAFTTLNIGSEVQSIPAYFCCSCSGLASVTIGHSVTSIGQHAFFNCSSLASLHCKAFTPPALDDEIWSTHYFNPENHWINYYDGDLEKFSVLSVPFGTKLAYQSTKGWDSFYTVVEE
jgi:hypothetical protein